MSNLHRYLDDSGSRSSDKETAPPRSDGMDYFALGGILIDDTDRSQGYEMHRVFLEKWGLTAPLHSTKIRGRREAFSFLGKSPEKARAFHADLNELILASPMIALACVIDRPGYVARYAGKYPKPWLLCQTAFAILVERAAKHAQRVGKRLVIYFEESGKKEHRAIMEYMKALKTAGMPFEGSAVAGYQSLSSDEFRSIVDGEPNRITKQVPMIQLADLVLYAMACGGYRPDYPPYRALHERGRIMDALLAPEDIPSLGVKYSCFDTTKARVSPSP